MQAMNLLPLDELGKGLRSRAPESAGVPVYPRPRGGTGMIPLAALAVYPAHAGEPRPDGHAGFIW